MTIRAASAGLALVALAWSGQALAQRSLFDQPTTQTPTQTTPAETTPAQQPKAKPKPKRPKGPVPARSLVIDNAGTSTLAALEVSQEGKSGKLAKPLAPKKKATLKLPAFKTCTVSVSATFEGGQPETSEVDICKEKSLRFTE